MHGMTLKSTKANSSVLHCVDVTNKLELISKYMYFPSNSNGRASIDHGHS